MVATWAMGGLYLSLGPSLAVVDLGLTNHVVEALVVSAFTGAGALAAVVVRERRAHPTMIGGAAVLAAGTTLTLLGLHAGSVGVFFVGTVVAGAGFGAGFLGAFRTLLMLAEPHQRAELLASVFVASYLSFSIPAIAAGLLVPVLSLGTTAAGYGVIVITLALLVVLAEGSRVLRASRQRRGLGAPEA
jgi:MFS family permease